MFPQRGYSLSHITELFLANTDILISKTFFSLDVHTHIRIRVPLAYMRASKSSVRAAATESRREPGVKSVAAARRRPRDTAARYVALLYVVKANTTVMYRAHRGLTYS